MIGLLDSIPVQQRPTYSHQTIFHHQRGPGLSNSVSMLCDKIIGKENISTLELTKLLDKILRKLKRVQDSEQLLNLNAIVIALKHISSSILVSIAPHKFFIQLEEPLRNVIEKWLTNSNLNDDEAFAFRNIIKLLRTLYKNAEHNDFHPSWLFDSPFLNIIATCLTNLSKPENRFFENTPFESKCLTRLLRIYDRYQERLHTQNSSNRDALIQLIDPIVQCITSENYLDSFRKLQSNSLDSKQKFFLLRCPSLFITYNGSRLKSIVNNVLSEMLPKYIAVLNEVVPSMKRWKKSIFPAVDNLLKIASHGSSSKKVIEAYRNFIDSMITIASSPILSNDLSYESSSSETNLIDTANNLFANRISKPTILAKAPGKQLQSNIQITSEEDIKTMPNSGISLSTILTSLKDSTHGNPNELDYHEIEQLLKTIRDLFQNDDMKKELLKQNQLPFLLELTDKIHGELLALLLEIIWSLSFIPEAALEIRSNPKFVRDIENISKNNENDEEISKASEGILWKIIQEPAVLEEKAKQHPKEKNADEIVEVSDVVNRTDGKEEVVMKNHQRASIEQAERVFKYDIMISYCHADKDLVKQIHKFLSGQGFKIWIDLDNMFGPAMSAMAEAVEESEFVFMCISDSYKQSTYCQAEAEYAFKRERRLLPIMVKPKYKPSGWLGFMLGSRIYIDFCRHDFDTACEKLLQEMSLQRKRPLLSKEGKVDQHVKLSAPPPPALVPEKTEKLQMSRSLPDIYEKRKRAFDFEYKSMESWTESDVLDFFFNRNLKELVSLCEGMDGLALLRLYNMCSSGNNEMFGLLKSELNAIHELRLPIGVYTRFLSNVESILRFPRAPPITDPPIFIYSIQPPAQQSKLPYDILVTSNATPSQVLKTIAPLLPLMKTRPRPDQSWRLEI